MKAVTQIFFSMAMLLVMASCKTKETAPTPGNDNVAFEVSEIKYNSIMQARSNGESRDFEIKDIKRENEVLKIWVSGGCDKNRYKVVWDGVMRKSYPLTVFLVVTLERGTGVECDAILDHILEVNLKEKFGEFYDANPFHIQLSNGSKVFDKIIDPRGDVSNK